MTSAALIAHLDASIAAAERLESKLAANGDPLMEVGGFCGLKTRHLFSNLGSLPGIRYLEIGVLHGATLLSAAYGNEGEFVGVDSFCQDFGGGADPAATRANVARWGNGRVTLIEADCWEADLRGPFDVLYYDGGHSREETARAFQHFLPVMAPAFLVLVDDASWACVDDGIQEGLAAWRESEQIKLRADRYLGVGVESDAAGYWNGLFCGVCRK